MPSGDTGGNAGGGFDFGADLASGYDSAISGGESELPSGGDEAQPSWGDSELFKADQPETPVAAQPAVDPAATPQPGADAASPYTLSPDGKFYQVPKSELPQFQQAQKYHSEVGKLFSTPQEAQQAQVQASNHRMLTNDLRSGDPNAVQLVLNHLAGLDHGSNPQLQKQFQQGFAQMATLLPATLQKVNPQAYEAMGAAMITGRIEAAYEKAALSGNPEDFRSAQEMDYGFTSQYKTDISQIQKPQTQQVSEQERRIQESESRYAKALDRDFKDFQLNGVENPKFTQLNLSLDKTLEKIKSRYEPVAYEDIKENIRRELLDTVNGTRAGLSPSDQANNAAWAFEHKQEHAALMRDYQDLWKNGGDVNTLRSRVQSYQQSFVSRANRLLPAIAQKRIGAATQAARARTQTGQFAADQPQTRQPAQQAATQQSGRTYREKADSEFAAHFDQFRS